MLLNQSGDYCLLQFDNMSTAHGRQFPSSASGQ
jgi:hypothetical protein